MELIRLKVVRNNAPSRLMWHFCYISFEKVSTSGVIHELKKKKKSAATEEKKVHSRQINNILNVTIYRRRQQKAKDGFGLRFNTATDGKGKGICTSQCELGPQGEVEMARGPEGGRWQWGESAVSVLIAHTTAAQYDRGSPSPSIGFA